MSLFSYRFTPRKKGKKGRSFCCPSQILHLHVLAFLMRSSSRRMTFSPRSTRPQSSLLPVEGGAWMTNHGRGRNSLHPLFPAPEASRSKSFVSRSYAWAHIFFRHLFKSLVESRHVMQGPWPVRFVNGTGSSDNLRVKTPDSKKKNNGLLSSAFLESHPIQF